MEAMRRHRPRLLPSSPSLGKPGKTILASVPQRGITDSDLGAPYDRYFHRLQGPQGRSLFPNSRHPKHVKQNYFEHRRTVIETREELAANIEAWGYGSASASTTEARRFATVRNFQVTHTVQLDDATQMRTVPPYATYYPSAIYYGYKYESAMFGSARQFSARVAADFVVASASVEGFKQKHRLQGRVQGWGLSPLGGSAIFSSPGHVHEHYRPSGPPVPIFVEYRQIPRRKGLQGSFSWQQATDVEVRFGRLDVVADGTSGTTPWSITVECWANGDRIYHWDLRQWRRRRVKSGHSYDLGWVQRLQMYPGDRLECGIRGHLSDAWTSKQAIATGRFAPQTVTPTMSNVGTIHASDHKTRYRLHWSATAFE